MYYRKIVPAGDLIRYLQEKIGELQVLGEDEIVAANLEVLTVDSVISDILYDREDDKLQNLEDCLRTVPPHIILDYIHYPEDEAKTDGYWETCQEIKNELWDGNIYPRIKDQLKTNNKEEEKEELEEIVFSDLD